MTVLSLLQVGSKIPSLLGMSGSDMASRLPDLVRSAGSDSLVEFTASTQVSPKAIVDASLTSNPNLAPILKTCNILVGSYYLMAVSIMLRHDGVQISEILDSVNPNRDMNSSISASVSKILGGLNDAYDGLSLPQYDPAKGFVAGNNSLYAERAMSALEAGNNANGNAGPSTGTSTNANSNTAPRESATLHKDMVNTLYGAGNLGTGTMIDVVFKSKDREISVPVMINVEVNTTSSNSVVDILKHAEQDTSLKERAWQWKNGLISSYDFITAMDLVDEHAEALRRDTTGLYGELRKRKKKNSLAGFLAGLAFLKRGSGGGRPTGLSVATASNIFIMDKTTANKLEMDIGGLLTDVRVRNRIFANSYAMIIMIVDTMWDTVTIYIRGHAQGSEYKISDIKSVSSKGNSAELISLGEAAMQKLTTPSLSGSRF